MMPVEVAQARMGGGHGYLLRMRCIQSHNVPSGLATEYLWFLGQKLRISGQDSRVLHQVAAQVHDPEDAWRSLSTPGASEQRSPLVGRRREVMPHAGMCSPEYTFLLWVVLIFATS